MVAAMRAHAGSAGVQEPACRALCNLASSNADQPILPSPQRAGRAVVAAMRTHAGSAEVQERACAALRNLACSNADNKWPSPRRAESGRGRCDADARRFGGVQEPRARRCATWNNADNRSAIAAAGGIEAVTAAMRAHPNLGDATRRTLELIS